MSATKEKAKNKRSVRMNLHFYRELQRLLRQHTTLKNLIHTVERDRFLNGHTFQLIALKERLIDIEQQIDTIRYCSQRSSS